MATVLQFSMFGEDKVIHLEDDPHSKHSDDAIAEMERTLLRFTQKIRAHKRERMKGIRPSLVRQ